VTARYLLDTNVISDAQKPQPNPRLAAWMEARADEELFIASIVLGEIWQGIVEKPTGRKKRDLLRWFASPTGPRSLFAGRILPLDEAAALQWAEFLAEGRRAGRPRSAVDMQIAAIAKVNGCTIVTRNVAHFAPVQGSVPVIDPTQAVAGAAEER
jgi:toxin FitB